MHFSTRIPVKKPNSKSTKESSVQFSAEPSRVWVPSFLMTWAHWHKLDWMRFTPDVCWCQLISRRVARWNCIIHWLLRRLRERWSMSWSMWMISRICKREWTRLQMRRRGRWCCSFRLSICWVRICWGWIRILGILWMRLSWRRRFWARRRNEEVRLRDRGHLRNKRLNYRKLVFLVARSSIRQSLQRLRLNPSLNLLRFRGQQRLHLTRCVRWKYKFPFFQWFTRRITPFLRYSHKRLRSIHLSLLLFWKQNWVLRTSNMRWKVQICRWIRWFHSLRI